jgi:predicted amidophosphoribosyltransferase
MVELGQEKTSIQLEVTPPVRLCTYCRRKVAATARFCDGCGRPNMVTHCACGRELERSDRYCDRCGKPVISG